MHDSSERVKKEIKKKSGVVYQPHNGYVKFPLNFHP